MVERSGKPEAQFHPRALLLFGDHRHRKVFERDGNQDEVLHWARVGELRWGRIDEDHSPL